MRKDNAMTRKQHAAITISILAIIFIIIVIMCKPKPQAVTEQTVSVNTTQTATYDITYTIDYINFAENAKLRTYIDGTLTTNGDITVSPTLTTTRYYNDNGLQSTTEVDTYYAHSTDDLVTFKYTNIDGKYNKTTVTSAADYMFFLPSDLELESPKKDGGHLLYEGTYAFDDASNINYNYHYYTLADGTPYELDMSYEADPQPKVENDMNTYIKSIGIHYVFTSTNNKIVIPSKVLKQADAAGWAYAVDNEGIYKADVYTLPLQEYFSDEEISSNNIKAEMYQVSYTLPTLEDSYVENYIGPHKFQLRIKLPAGRDVNKLRLYEVHTDYIASTDSTETTYELVDSTIKDGIIYADVTIDITTNFIFKEV